MLNRPGLQLLTTAGLLLSTALPARCEEAPNPAAAMIRAMTEAEQNLRIGESQVAESLYRTALVEGWLLLGSLQAAGDDLEAAKTSFEKALDASIETRRARTALGLTLLRLGESSEAVNVLRAVVARNPADPQNRQLLAQALVAAGRPEEAVQELEEALIAAPEDAESAFNLAAGHLRVGNVERAEELFARVLKQRPIPQTHVLIGRTWRDYKEYERAAASLHAALEMDPKVRRARYYLGTVALIGGGRDRLEEALGLFEEELALDPEDPMTNLYYGLALAESYRFDEAIPPLEVAAEWKPTRIDALRFLGRCHLGADRPGEAVRPLWEALEMARSEGARDRQLSNIHYQLGLALRRSGAEEQAATHFAAAEQVSGELVEGDRDRFTRFLEDSRELETDPDVYRSPLETSLADLGSPQRLELEAKVSQGLARAYMNLGVLRMQRAGEDASRFMRAAELLEEAAGVAPDFPRVQHTLGVAYFNAGEFTEATAPLSRALEEDPGNGELKRMLALAWLNVEDYAKAADLLAGDPTRASNPSLQYAYGLALVRSGRAGEAQEVFDQLLAANADWPELHVLLGQGHAQQDDYDAAVASLERAIELKADVAEAHATLGNIYLRQGKLDEAEQAYLTELSYHPEDTRSRYHLATVLELNRKTDEAKAHLEQVLAARPDFADARYLLGKILLADGAASEAAAHLEAAARLAPEDPNVVYQLAQAYQRLGEREMASRQFELYRELKKNERDDGEEDRP